MLEILVTQKINLFIVYCMISIAVNPIFKEKIVTSEEERAAATTHKNSRCVVVQLQCIKE